MLVDELKQLEYSNNNIDHEINSIINQQYYLNINNIINIFKQDIKNKYYNNRYAIIQDKKIIQGTYIINRDSMFYSMRSIKLNKIYVEREHDLCYIRNSGSSVHDPINSYLEWKEPLLLNQTVSSLFKKSNIIISLSPFGKKLINDLKSFCKNEGIQITKVYACYSSFRECKYGTDCELNKTIKLKTKERQYCILKLNYEIAF